MSDLLLGRHKNRLAKEQQRSKNGSDVGLDENNCPQSLEVPSVQGVVSRMLLRFEASVEALANDSEGPP